MIRTVRGLAGAASGLALLGLASPVAGTAPETLAGMSHGVIHIAGRAGGRFNTNQSNNWSGYNIGAGYPGEPAGVTFTSISGEWTVPTARQHVKGQAEDSASWVGIGGGCVTGNCPVTDNTLIQAGTEQPSSVLLGQGFR